MGNLKAKPQEPTAAAATGADAGEAPAAAAAPARSSAKSGAYLVYTSESGGELYLHWSDTAVPGALAFFSPRKAVPHHKKTQNAGRLELIRGIIQTKHKMLEGAVHFVKEAALLDSDVKLLSNQHFDMWYCQGTAVKEMKVGESVNCSKIGALAVMPHANTSFKGVKKIDVSQFVNTATREGAAWKH